jgi:hypothetical protein
MARRGRRGSLSPKTYFPSTGDQLQLTEEGLLWECAKSNSIAPRAGHKGEKIRYALLVGVLAESTEEIVMAIHDRDDRDWLDDVDVIHRRIPSGLMGSSLRSYDWNEETRTWQQRLQDS